MKFKTLKYEYLYLSGVKYIYGDNTLDSIVAMEWTMMKDVDNISELVIVQRDKEKFRMVRESQLEIFSDVTLESYKQDLIQAIREDRNLIKEKYAYMIKNINIECFNSIKNKLPTISDKNLGIARNLTNMVIEDKIILSKEYPLLTIDGRPVFSEEDTKDRLSIETYHISEFMTYSTETLINLKTDYVIIKEAGKNIAKEILIKIVKKLGYISLEQADKMAKINLIV